MTKTEALSLAAQLGAEVRSANALWDWCEARGLSIGTENATGDWVVLDCDQNVKARCA